MLLQIEIRNIAIIDYTLVDFEKGYHVLTGETGAGKSIILDAISLLTGGRAQKELIRMGQEEASVKGVLAVTDENKALVKTILGDIKDEYVTVERLLSKDGKSIAKINGKIEPVKHLKEIVGGSLEMCGQKSHIDLMKEAYYRELVDSLASDEMDPLLSAYQETYRTWRAKREEWLNWQQNDREQEQMMDLYQYQIQEIEEANLEPGEEEVLEAEKKRLMSFEKLSHATQKALQVCAQLKEWHQVVSAVELMADVDDEMASLLERVHTLQAEMDDVHYEVDRYADNLEYDEARLNELVLREEDIKKIKRKYGNTIEEVLVHYEEIQEKVSQYERKEEVIVELEKTIRQLESQMKTEAKALHVKRCEVARLLSEDVEKELHVLAMPHAEFRIRVESVEQYHEYGCDDVQAYFNANKGEEIRPLTKIASGGEMARVLLAIKVVVNERNPGKTLIFDEVDEGIGGDVGRIIGQNMERLGKQNQVIVISHLPQVAAKADVHYRIEKQVKDDRTFSTIERLGESERVEEIARMLYGTEANDITKEQAKKMLEKK